MPRKVSSPRGEIGNLISFHPDAPPREADKPTNFAKNQERVDPLDVKSSGPFAGRRQDRRKMDRTDLKSRGKEQKVHQKARLKHILMATNNETIDCGSDGMGGEGQGRTKNTESSVLAQSLKRADTFGQGAPTSKAEKRVRSERPKMGQVGYKFMKFFVGHGYFTGTVVLIRPGAANGKDRRVVYEDGDSEDVSMKQLANYRPVKSTTQDVVSAAHKNLLEAGTGGISCETSSVGSRRKRKRVIGTIPDQSRSPSRMETVDDASSDLVSMSEEGSVESKAALLPMVAKRRQIKVDAPCVNTADTKRQGGKKVEVRKRAPCRAGKAEAEPLPSCDTALNSGDKKIESKATITGNMSPDQATESYDSDSTWTDNSVLSASETGSQSNSPGDIPKEIRSTPCGCDTNMNHVSQSNLSKSQSIEASGGNDQPPSQASTCDLFLGDDIPSSDEAATDMVEPARTEEKDKVEGDITPACRTEENEDDNWLEEVAAKLAGKGKASNNKRPMNVLGSCGTEGDALNDRSSDCANTKLILLQDVDRGKKFGKKVFRLEDSTRTVGEVVVDEKGWIEAVIGGSMVKARATAFVVAPNESSVGDSVDERIPIQTSPSSQRIVSSASSAKGTMSLGSQGSNGLGPKTAPPRATAAKAPNRAASTVSRPVNITLDTFFYWACRLCTMTNSYKATKCAACETKRSKSSKISALLEIAKCAAIGASTLDEAEMRVPAYHRPAIPREVLTSQLTARARNFSVLPTETKNGPEVKLDDFFYWICGYCTVVNSYKAVKCRTCAQRRSVIATDSALLEIAVRYTISARTMEEGRAMIPVLHRWAIPDIVLSSLITCIARAGPKSKSRRCLNPKAPGCDYCHYHFDTTKQLPETAVFNRDRPAGMKCKQSSDGASVADSCSAATSGIATTDGSSIASSLCDVPGRRPTLEGGKAEMAPECSDECLPSGITEFFCHRTNSDLVNVKNWTVRSVEDAFLAEEKAAYPLGLKVRRFFPGYGFHDGRLISVQRKEYMDSEKGVKRPVLIYRAVYEDGDEEDFIHHEVSSLRQIYDVRNVAATASPSLQLEPGTRLVCQRQGGVQIVRHSTPQDASNQDEGGLVHVNFFRKCGGACSSLRVDLTELQVNVVRKGSLEDVDETESSESNSSTVLPVNDVPCTPATTLPAKDEHLEGRRMKCAPALEWPKHAPEDTKHGAERDAFTANSRVHKVEDGAWMLARGMWVRSDDFEEDEEEEESDDDEADVDSEAEIPESSFSANESVHMNDPLSTRCADSINSSGIWDPASISTHLDWDPFGHMSCEICHSNKDDDRILICDHCHLGYHMYCVRPIIVNVPKDDWCCPRCSNGHDEGKSFSEVVDECTTEVVSDFLRLPYETVEDFYKQYREEVKLTDPANQSALRQRCKAVAKSKPVAKIGAFFVSKHVEKSDFVLVKPLPNSSTYRESLQSIVAAMKHCGMTAYSDVLVYGRDGITEDVNDSSLESVHSLSQRNLEVYKSFKANARLGLLPPLKVVYEKTIGFAVEALATIQRHTLITEYVGEITTVEKSGETSSDSLMVLLNTGDPKTSLIIDPTRTGNIARFLNGVNNGCYKSRRKANVRTRRFAMDGGCRVVLFAARKIEAGEKLYYDYNAGVEGKDVEEWAKNGFYDTSNFV